MKTGQRPWVAAAIAVAVLLAPAAARSPTATRELPASLSNAEFARLMAAFSEPGGAFHSDNFTSNEPQLVAVAKLLSSRPAGGVYIGVGPEQNFTLIAASRPRLAFVLDIRRQAIVQHLLFKALFELSEDRIDFLGRLFSRARPDGLSRSAPLAAIWDAIKAAPSDAALYRARRAEVETHLRDARGLTLPAADLAHLDYVFKAFFELGPAINYGGYQQGLSTSNVDFARLSLAADADGVLRSFLGSDGNFQLIREMHRRNLIVPIEGDFAGPKALRAIGEYVRSHDAQVDTFYISNVEQYLFGQSVARQTDRNGGYTAFYENAATLPVNDNSIFVRVLNLASPAPFCPISIFLKTALTRPITSIADARTCAGTTTEPIAPTSPQAALGRARPSEVFTTRVQTGNDVTWLEGMASSEEFLRREWMNAVGTDQVSANLRMDAYVRLGAIGTPESLAAVRRIDAGLRRQSILAEPSLTGWMWPVPGPGSGSGGGRMVALNAVQSGDREYAVVVSEIDGPLAPFVLTRTRGDGRWQRPRLVGAPIPNASSFDTVVTIDADALMIAFQRRPATSDIVRVPPPLRVPLAAIEQDTDGDGWTDIEERALGLRPDLDDTDGDGISDRLDATPLHKPAPDEERDEDARIIRRAWFAAYAMNGSRYAIFVPPGHRAVQLYGLTGPVLFDVALPPRTGCGRGARPGLACPPVVGGAQVSWTLTRPGPTDAVMTFSTAVGLNYRSTARATLKKIGDDWVVVECRIIGMN